MSVALDFIFKAPMATLPEKGSFAWKTPSNIALVKYWGKYGMQLPKNPSISFTLDACFTLTTLEFKRKQSKEINFDIYFEGEKKDGFKPKIWQFFERIQQYASFIINYHFIIHTRNSFPHSSGIASSASGMAALSLCIMSMEKALNPTMTDDYFYKKASFLARLGSGSASRSIEGPVVVWGKHQDMKGSNDLYGIPFPFTIHKNFKNFHDTILLVDKGEKQVSSTIGHNLMVNHPFAKERFNQASKNLSLVSETLQNGGLDAFINIVESEALTLHAMMLTSHPYFILMKPNTLSIINKIWEYRAQTNAPICFTLDAGANVHILYPEKEKTRINQFIMNELLPFCQKNHYICDRVGFGAKQIL